MNAAEMKRRVFEAARIIISHMQVSKAISLLESFSVINMHSEDPPEDDSDTKKYWEWKAGQLLKELENLK